MIGLQNFNFIKIDKNNEQQMNFLKELFQNKEDKSMNYLGDLTNMNDENAYIVLNDNLEQIGYFSMSTPVLNHQGLQSSSLYYAISPKYRGQGYATKLLMVVSDYLLEKIEIVILSIDKNNESSRKVAEKNNFKIIFEDEDDCIYAKEANYKKKSK